MTQRNNYLCHQLLIIRIFDKIDNFYPIYTQDCLQNVAYIVKDTRMHNIICARNKVNLMCMGLIVLHKQTIVNSMYFFKYCEYHRRIFCMNLIYGNFTGHGVTKSIANFVVVEYYLPNHIS